MDYDEELVLYTYAFEHDPQLMTDLERRVAYALIARLKASASGNSAYAMKVLKEWGKVGDPEIDAALADGPDDFRRRVAKRILGDAEKRVAINRCPVCHRIVNTPQARQCFWCGYDWHET